MTQVAGRQGAAPCPGETIHVLDGELRWRLGDEVQSAGTGTYVFIPRGLPHCFQVMGGRPARMLITFAPAGMEPFFERLSALTEFDAPSSDGRRRERPI